MRRWFQSRQLREQVLMATFFTLAVLAWGFSALGRVRSRATDWKSAREDLAAQQLWLDRQPEIEARSRAAVRDLDPARTYDATRLVAVITGLADEAGLAPAVDSPATQQTAQFSHHRVRVAFQRAKLDSLLKFYDALSRQTPYLSLDRITVQAERADADVLSVTLQISATQIAGRRP